jgi:glutathione synthase/RimK-type ligase-like ATP-grasp enzyme
MNEKLLQWHRRIADIMREVPGMRLIQDPTQVELYEDKIGQTQQFHPWMPHTELAFSEADAQILLSDMTYPFISKAKVGASSCNVRLITNMVEARREIELVFVGDGIPNLSHYPNQKGYLIWQEYISHDVTWRVNIIGTKFFVFKRYNFADRPMAQTGNVEPVLVMDDKIASLLEYTKEIAAEIETKWCAFDILEGPNGWLLLETTLGWPWPSPGNCDECVCWNSPHKWADMFKVLFDEIEAGEWPESVLADKDLIR